MAYPELTDKQRNYPYSGNMQLPPVVPETRGVVSPTGATPEQTAQGKQNWQSNAPQQFANNPVGTVQHNIFKAREQQQAQPVLPPKNTNQGNGTIKVTDSQPNPYSATETGGARPIRNMDELVSAMYTDPKEEERLRKASVANQRILAVGDALRHIGNIFNTVNYAPAQKFNNPVQEEYDRYQKGKAIRDAANARYYSYMQAKAAQDARMRQAERQLQYNAARDAAKMQAQQNQWEAQNKERARQFDQNYKLNVRKADDAKANADARLKETTAYHNKMAGIAGMNAKTNRDRATAYINKLKGGSSASGTPLVTPNGSIYAPGKSIPQAQMNQLYKKGIDSGWIKQSEFQTKMREAGFGKADPDYVRNQMVVEAMMEHGDFADFARDNYGWQYGSNGGGGNNLSIGWDDDEDEGEDNGLSIGW